MVLRSDIRIAEWVSGMDEMLMISGTKDSWNTGVLVHETQTKPVKRHIIMCLNILIPCKDTKSYVLKVRIL